ncbi:hypothetical protein J5U18_09680 [Sphingobacteriaceae bacterium WQ 2009]|uniref:Phospholipid/glycerol acyltransferase domain-containing protein n=1 Tax=Rhinopithecimicrobium faecis TaxID=2820698 RepID=A0A8T4HBM7_9SPHI|nr:hypothetical protein [Sphingobacteriaceae bacterium WQ 2009]
MKIDTEQYARDFSNEVLLDLADNFFQAEIDGDFSFLNYYNQRPIIIIGNHAGAGLSWDNIIFDALFLRLTSELTGRGIKLSRLIHARLYDDQVRPFLLKNWWQRMGCLKANMANFETLCQQNKIIYISPEGARGMIKGACNKNRVQRYSSSFIYMAKKYNAIIVSMAVINSEYLLPAARMNRSFNTWLETNFSIPYLPIHPLVISMLLPRFYIVCLPARLLYKVLRICDAAELGENTVAVNRLEAEYFRRQTEEAIQRNDYGLLKAINMDAVLTNLFSIKKITAAGIYRKFWEFELQRKLTWIERCYFSCPIIGYYLVKRYMHPKVKR